MTVSPFRFVQNFRSDAAEWFYRNALDGCRKLAERSPAAYAPRVAEACGNLAGLLKTAGRIREAAALYRVALETYVKLAQEDPAKWEPELAFLYENLAAFEALRSPSAGKALLRSAWTLYQKYSDLAAEAERVRAQIRELQSVLSGFPRRTGRSGLAREKSGQKNLPFYGGLCDNNDGRLIIFRTGAQKKEVFHMKKATRKEAGERLGGELVKAARRFFLL